MHITTKQERQNQGKIRYGKNSNFDAPFKDKREQALVQAMRAAMDRGDKKNALEFALTLKQEGYSSKWWDDIRRT